MLVGGVHEELNPDEPVPASRLDGIKLVIPGRPNVLRAQVEHALTRKGMTMNVAVETDTLTLCMELARRGVGSTVAPACAVNYQRFGEVVSWAPIRGLFMTWALCENQARTHSAAVREGRRLVFETVAAAIKSREWFGAEPVGPIVGRKRAADLP